MKTLKIYGIVTLASLLSFLFARSAWADGETPGGGCPPGQLCNPLQANDIGDFLTAIIDIILVFALPIVVFFIMYAGFLFVTARGDTGKVEDARRALLWAVVGGVIVLGAKIIAELINTTVSGLQV